MEGRYRGMNPQNPQQSSLTAGTRLGILLALARGEC